MKYMVFLQSHNGKTTAMSEPLNDSVFQPRLAKELLPILSPYARCVGGERWIGSEVLLEPLPEDSRLHINLAEESAWLAHLSMPQEFHQKFEKKFGTWWAVSNFTKGKYLTSPGPIANWLSGDVPLGQQLLALLQSSDPNLCWSDCQLGVVPEVFPWMTDVTEASKKLTERKAAGL